MGKLTLEDDEVMQLKQWISAHGSPQQVVMHSRIALGAVEGRSDLEMAAELDVNRHTVRL